MEEKKEVRRKKFRKFDYRLDFYLLLGLSFLIFFGLIALTSASISAGIHGDSGNPLVFVEKQIGFTLIGVIVMIFVSFVPYTWWRKFSYLAIFGSALMVVLLQIDKTQFPYLYGAEINGARRWLVIFGFQFQVTDFIRFSAILFLAHVITKLKWGIRKGRFLGIGQVFFVLTLAIALAGGILVFTKNLSTALIVLGIAAMMVIVVYPHEKLTIGALIGAVIAVIALIQYILQLPPGAGDYHFKRIKMWFDPFNPVYLYDDNGSYQTVQSLYAIGRGGLLGVGLGNGIQKLGNLPEPYNDFIFSVICEELGFVGALFLILLYIYFLVQVFLISTKAKDTFGSMLAVGIFSHFAFQVIVNIGVCTNMLPNTGVGLPFISYGGTAQVVLLGEVGILLSIYRFSKNALLQSEKKSIPQRIKEDISEWVARRKGA